MSEYEKCCLMLLLYVVTVVILTAVYYAVLDYKERKHRDNVRKANRKEQRYREKIDKVVNQAKMDELYQVIKNKKRD